MKNLQKFEVKLNRNSVVPDGEVRNIPFTSGELHEEAKATPKFRLMNTEPNRMERRSTLSKRNLARYSRTPQGQGKQEEAMKMHLELLSRHAAA